MDMGRLTERLDGDGLCYGKVDCEDNCTYCDRFLKVLDKLADYEDLEEQGLLLRLPCKIGRTLYQPINSHINEYKVIGLCFDIFRNKWSYEVAYEIIGEWQKTICDFEVIGTTVFLTREEAKQALAEMQKG